MVSKETYTKEIHKISTQVLVAFDGTENQGYDSLKALVEEKVLGNKLLNQSYDVIYNSDSNSKNFLKFEQTQERVETLAYWALYSDVFQKVIELAEELEAEKA